MRTMTFNRVIGTGGIGTVYQATLKISAGFSRQCAIKVMNGSAPDQEHWRARMRDEARLLGMLQDEQILGVSELVRIEGRDCVVMEYVEGVDLSELIQARSIPPRALAEMGAELAGTLHRAHHARHPQSGEPLHVIHRDVKPANVMISNRGGVKLLDFGVARAAFDARESHTHGLVLGTLNYFPPEILSGEDPTPAVDIYGLGLTLWECATGKEWGSPQVHRHRFERRVEQRLEEVKAPFDSLTPALRKMLAWDPSQRPNGSEVEKILLDTAARASGAGLRVWSREAVPVLLAKRTTSSLTGDWLGQTLNVEATPDPKPKATPPAPRGHGGLEPLPPPRSAGSSYETMTYNDLAPPAAVKRSGQRAKPKPAPAAQATNNSPQSVASPVPPPPAPLPPEPAAPQRPPPVVEAPSAPPPVEVMSALAPAPAPPLVPTIPLALIGALIGLAFVIIILGLLIVLLLLVLILSM